MALKTRVQSQVESYQGLKKWYLIYPCLTLSITRYISRVKWNNPRKGVMPFPTLRIVAIEKGVSGSPSTTVANFTYLYVKNMLFLTCYQVMLLYLIGNNNNLYNLSLTIRCSLVSYAEHSYLILILIACRTPYIMDSPSSINTCQREHQTGVIPFV